jgi:hypothetical protein
MPAQQEAARIAGQAGCIPGGSLRRFPCASADDAMKKALDPIGERLSFPNSSAGRLLIDTAGYQ